MSDELKEKVKKWLSTHGYPLEMRTAQAFRNAGYSVQQGTRYADPLEGTSREIDVFAHFQRTGATAENPKSLTVALSFAVECKSSPDSPWVVFLAEGAETEVPSFVRTWPRGGAAVDAVIDRLAGDWSRFPTVFPDHFPVGYGLVRALKSDGHDLPYYAMMQVLSATKARLNRIHDARELNGCHIILPLVVLNGRMFHAWVGGDSDLALEEVERSVLLVEEPALSFGHSVPVTIITLEGLEAFCADAKAMTAITAISQELVREFE